ncbi:MAG TPA: hypothetical protein VGI39_06830 [Polyangiaceae bacterium]|jgi:hypothetical protein
MLKPVEFAKVTVKTEGAFVMLVDASSPVNREEFWMATWTPSQRAARVSELTRVDDLFMWTVLLDGTFRVALRVRSTKPGSAAATACGESFELNLPTGHLIVRSSVFAIAALSVAPGVYGGTLLWDTNREIAHSTIPSVNEYPEEEGLDGAVEIWRIA